MMFGSGIYGYGYFSYLIFMIPVFILGMWAQSKVKRAYSIYSGIQNSKNITGAMAAQEVLRHYGILNVAIGKTEGKLSDNFNPKANTIYLSEDVYYGTSIAAVGIACHEAGHAAQHAEGYVPNKIRSAIIPVCNFGSRFGIIIAVIGMFVAAMSYYQTIGTYMIYAGLILYGMVAVFQLVTLPVEFNASHRALKVIDETDLLTGEEAYGAKKVLSAAAMTYVAALATSVAQLLYFILRFTGNNRRN